MSKLVRAAKPYLLKLHLSNKYAYAQVVRSEDRHIIAAASTIERDLREALKSGTTKEACELVGKRLAERLSTAGIPAVHWDRKHGQRYHGRLAALLEGLKSSGVSLD